MRGGFAQPAQDGVFLDPFDPRQCTDAIAFRQEGQHFQDSCSWACLRKKIVPVVSVKVLREY